MMEGKKIKKFKCCLLWKRNI